VNGGGITKNRKDSTIKVLGLKPYIDYYVELNTNNFDYIAWVVKNKTMNIAINPNQLRLIEVPVSVMGEVSGMVYINKNGSQQGQGGVRVYFYDSNSKPVANVLTEEDGYIYYLGLDPDTYTAKIDSNQLSKLEMTVTPDGIPFTILPSEDGDIVDDLEFVITKNQPNIKTKKNNNIEIKQSNNLNK
jgi:homogentisate 1,2-dioxygenase